MSSFPEQQDVAVQSQCWFELHLHNLLQAINSCRQVKAEAEADADFVDLQVA